VARLSKLGENHLWMEYGTTEPRTLTLELLFDGYEEGKPIAEHVENLERLTLPVDMSSKVVSKRRPQLCVAVWGNQSMRCVVTSVATKLTMFATDGSPLRATCTVVLKEVDVIAMMKADGDKSDVDAQQSGYVSDSRTSRQMPYPPEDSKPTKVPTPNRTQPAPAPASAPAPSKTVGTPSKKINPAALEGNGPSSDQLFLDDPPAPAPAPDTVGTPSKKINPAALDGGPEAGPLYTDASPAPASNTVGTPSKKINPAALDGGPEAGPLYTDDPPAPAPDAVSGADPAGPNAKTKAVYDDLE